MKKTKLNLTKNKYILLIIIGVLILSLFTFKLPFLADIFFDTSQDDIIFEDTAERYSVDGINQYWNTTVDTGNQESCTVQQYPTTYNTLNSVKMYTKSNDDVSNHNVDYWIETNDPAFKDYFTLTSYKWNFYSSQWTATSSPSANAKIIIVNESGGILATATMYSVSLSSPSGDRSDTTSHVYEIFGTYGYGNDIYLKKDGVLVGTIGAYNCDPPYHVRISIKSRVDDYAGGWGYTEFYFDDASTQSVIGLNKNWNELNEQIECSYKVEAFDSYNDSHIHYLNLYKTSTGELVNSTILSNRAGFKAYNRTDFFGENYGMYKLKILRDSTTLAEKSFYYGQIMDGGIYTNIEIPVTPSVGAYIYDSDDNGDNVNAGNTIWLTPAENGIGIYDVHVLLTTIPDNFQLMIDADSEYVDMLNVTFENLQKTYQVSYNDVQLNNTVGTETTYSITDFGNTFYFTTPSTTSDSSSGGGGGGGGTVVPTIDTTDQTEITNTEYILDQTEKSNDNLGLIQILKNSTNNYIWLLLIIVLILSVYIIYNKSKNKK